jgi:RNA polymerase sigma-70 factor (ECF subfamily)
LDTAEQTAHGAFSVASSQNEAAEITSALGKLSAEHRTVLLLAVIEGFTCQEVAGIVGLPIGTVMSRLSRARQALRENLSPRESSREALRANAACAAKQA